MSTFTKIAKEVTLTYKHKPEDVNVGRSAVVGGALGAVWSGADSYGYHEKAKRLAAAKDLLTHSNPEVAAKLTPQIAEAKRLATSHLRGGRMLGYTAGAAGLMGGLAMLRRRRHMNKGNTTLKLQRAD